MELFQLPSCFNNFKLATQAELGYYIAITTNFCRLQIVQQLPALSDQFDQSALGMVVLAVLFEVLSQVSNAVREHSHLSF